MNDRNGSTRENRGWNLLTNLDDSLYVVAAYLVRYLNSLRRVQKKLTP